MNKIQISQIKGKLYESSSVKIEFSVGLQPLGHVRAF